MKTNKQIMAGERKEARDELENMQTAIEGAPVTATSAKNLRGWWTPIGWYVCADCAGRIMARGCSLPNKSEAVWTDRAEPYGKCCLCQVK